jgi:hypothetical protein
MSYDTHRRLAIPFTLHPDDPRIVQRIRRNFIARGDDGLFYVFLPDESGSYSWTFALRSLWGARKTARMCSRSA